MLSCVKLFTAKHLLKKLVNENILSFISEKLKEGMRKDLTHDLETRKAGL